MIASDSKTYVGAKSVAPSNSTPKTTGFPSIACRRVKPYQLDNRTKKTWSAMPRARIKAEKAMYGQRVEIDAAWDPLTEFAAPVPIRRTTSINAIPRPLLPSSRTDYFIIVFAFGLLDVKHKSSL